MDRHQSARRAAVILALCSALLWLGGCETCPDGSMLESEGGLELMQEEHLDGWGQSNCHSCHQVESLHRRGCTDGVNLADVRELVDEQGLDVCSTCHGDNGVGEDATAEVER